MSIRNSKGAAEYSVAPFFVYKAVSTKKRTIWIRRISI